MTHFLHNFLSILSKKPDYEKTVDVKIFAKSFFGARHALVTLQQLLWYDDEDGSLKIINQAFIDDVPKFK